MEHYTRAFPACSSSDGLSPTARIYLLCLLGTLHWRSVSHCNTLPCKFGWQNHGQIYNWLVSFILARLTFNNFLNQLYFMCVQVTNYLPSVSAATGDFPLSKFVWRLCIAIHAGPRFIVAGMYYRYLRSVVYQKYMKLSLLTCLLNVVENIALLGLTFVSSDDDYRK